MKIAASFRITLWFVVCLSLILLVDVLLSAYKIVVYREAIVDALDFAIVLLVYVGTGAVAGLTCLSAFLAMIGNRYARTVRAMQGGAVCLAILLLIANSVTLPEWASTALSNKNVTLIACLLLCGLIYWCLRDWWTKSAPPTYGP